MLFICLFMFTVAPSLSVVYLLVYVYCCSQSQYVFIHEALMESIMCGDNSIKAPNLKKRVKELKETMADTGLSGFETQFKVFFKKEFYTERIKFHIFYNLCT